MLDEMRYINSIGEAVELSEFPCLFGVNELRNYSWEAKNRNGKYILNKTTKEFTAPLIIKADSEERQEILDIFEYDTLKGKRGRLYINDDYIYCCVSGIDVLENYSDICKYNLHFVADSFDWCRDVEYILNQNSSSFGVEDELENFSTDFSPNTSSTNYIENTQISDADFICTLFGATLTDFDLIIGDSEYKLTNTALHQDEYIKLNTYDKSVVKKDENNRVSSIFSSATGETYIFQKIPKGKHAVYWNSDSNTILITLIEHRRFPRWI